MSLPLDVNAYLSLKDCVTSTTRRKTIPKRPPSPNSPDSPDTSYPEPKFTTARSRSLPDLFKARRRLGIRFRTLGETGVHVTEVASSLEDSSRPGDPERPRPKHIPIVLPSLLALTLPGNSIGLSHKRPSALSSTIYACGSSVPEVPLPRRQLSLVSRGQQRHVEIVVPHWTDSVGVIPVVLEHRETNRTTEAIDLRKKDSPPILAMSRPTGASRSNTLDSAISAPSPTQLYLRNGQTSALRMNSSQTSLHRQEGYDSGSEQESPHSSQGSTPQQLHSSSSLSPAVGQSSASISGTSGLSNLVCDVYRTTGKEPHALVGATTTILGDNLYVFGGKRISRTRPVLTADLYVLDLLKRHWTKVETSGDVPPARYFHSMCALGDSKLICYGGMSPGPSTQSNQGNQGEPSEVQVSVMSDVHIYDVPTSSWMKVNVSETPQGRYAHCAAILPSSAVFTSANAPMSAVQHNPAGRHPNQGSLGVSLDGAGGAEMVVVGGQDSASHYIEQISVFNLRSLKWTSTRPMAGRSCGAYRSVVTPLTNLSATQRGAGPGRLDEDDEESDEEDDMSLSGSSMLIYTNYNFLDVKVEVQVRMPDGSLTEKPMQGSTLPPGLRFPSGGVIDNNFVVAGTHLTSTKQEFALWALDLRTLTWARIETGSSVFSQGSWNRGVMWNRRNAFVILGNRKRNLVDDYQSRRLNFSNICLVELEAFGLYDNPRKLSPRSGYVSVSAPSVGPMHEVDNAAGGRLVGQGALDLGTLTMGLKEMSDMDFLALDGTRLPVNSRLMARRWGPSFTALLQESAASLGNTETSTLRPSAASIMSRNSSVTITPSVSTAYSGATTLTANTGGAGSAAAGKGTLPDPRTLPPNSRPRTLYLPHTVPTLQTLIYYLYTSSLPPNHSSWVSPQILCSLLQLARPYKIDGLLEAVLERLHESLDGRNTAAIFNAAAMAAGGGDGVVFTPEKANVHPPRTVSLAGIESLNLNSFPSTGRGPLRIDTDVANGMNHGRHDRNVPGSAGGANGHADDDNDVPDSASSTASMGSQISLSGRQGNREEREVWEGGWSAVVGLQKRGLRGLMEARRMRERGSNDGAAMGESGSGRVGLGIA